VRAITSLLMGLLIGAQALIAADAPVALVWTSGIGPFEEAVAGFRAGLGGVEMVSIDLKSKSAPVELEQLAHRPPRLLVAAGAGALAALQSHHVGAPTLATMVLRSDAFATHEKTSALFLDVPVAEIAAKLRVLFPGKFRLGVIRNPQLDPGWEPPRIQGYTVEVRDCTGPENLLKTFLSLKRKADFVLLQPDSTLYNEATVKPLLMASIENQLPIIGFSASFVRAGAALGFYPDYKDIGAQTADLALRYLRSNSAPVSETPRTVVLAANQGVLRLLGLDYKTSPETPLVVIR
jgi:hypothetical protein